MNHAIPFMLATAAESSSAAWLRYTIGPCAPSPTGTATVAGTRFFPLAVTVTAVLACKWTPKRTVPSGPVMPRT